MKTGHKAAALSCLAVGAGAAACWRWMFRMPLKEFTRYALYMAVMDDEICRNELEGNWIGDKVITFPPKIDTLQGRYHLFLKMNQTKSRRQIQKEIRKMEQRPAQRAAGGGVFRRKRSAAIAASMVSSYSFRKSPMLSSTVWRDCSSPYLMLMQRFPRLQAGRLSAKRFRNSSSEKWMEK